MRRILKALGRAVSSPFRGLSAAFEPMRQFFTDEPEDTPFPDVVTKSVSDIEGVMYHIDALRKHLLRAVLALALTTAISFIFTPRVIDFLAKPIGGINSLTAIEVTEPVSVFMRVALLVGFAISLPYIAFEIWLFIAPGLQPKSRIYGLIALPTVSIFFLMGVAFAYFVMMPPALLFLLNFMEMNSQVRPASYIKFVTSLLFWVGITFEFPWVIFVMANLGLVKAGTLFRQWRLAIVIIAVLAAVITPTIDPVSMGLVMGPMIILYFFSILLAALAERGRRDKAEQEDKPDRGPKRASAGPK